MSKPKFIPGMELNRGYYKDVIRPLLKKHFPDLKYSAGFIGHGSDVLGYDTPRSMDHNWGPQLRIFLRPGKTFEREKNAIDRMLRANLPYTYKGFSTNYTKANPDDYLVQKATYIKKGEVNHLTEYHTVGGFFTYYLNFDPYKRLSIRDWLIFPEHSLLEVTAGEVWHDDLDLCEKRKKFAYYPEEVWKYLLAIQWGKIANAQALMGRTGEVGDELGSQIVGIIIVRDIMRLCFLMEKTYAPYAKWFGTAFSELKIYKKINPLLQKVAGAKNWKERDKYLSDVYEIIAKKHNELKITKPMHTKVTEYHGRPYHVIRADLFYEEIRKNIKSWTLKNIKYPLGKIDQFVDHLRLSDKRLFTQFKTVLT